MSDNRYIKATAPVSLEKVPSKPNGGRCVEGAKKVLRETAQTN